LHLYHGTRPLFPWRSRQHFSPVAFPLTAFIPVAPSARYQRPALVLRDRRTFLYAHLVSQLRRIGFVMGMVLLAPPYRLFVERMRETTLNPHDNGFVIRVADHDTL
jgi:hypothetical protein